MYFGWSAGFLVEAVSDLPFIYLWEQLESFEYINQVRVFETWYKRRSEAIVLQATRKSQVLAVKFPINTKSKLYFLPKIFALYELGPKVLSIVAHKNTACILGLANKCITSSLNICEVEFLDYLKPVLFTSMFFCLQSSSLLPLLAHCVTCVCTHVHPSACMNPPIKQMTP